jgi:hypothetical protein
VGIPIVLLAETRGVDAFEGFSGRLDELSWLLVASALLLEPLLESLLVWVAVWLLQSVLASGWRRPAW